MQMNSFMWTLTEESLDGSRSNEGKSKARRGAVGSWKELLRPRPQASSRGPQPRFQPRTSSLRFSFRDSFRSSNKTTSFSEPGTAAVSADQLHYKPKEVSKPLISSSSSTPRARSSAHAALIPDHYCPHLTAQVRILGEDRHHTVYRLHYGDSGRARLLRAPQHGCRKGSHSVFFQEKCKFTAGALSYTSVVATIVFFFAQPRSRQVGSR